jgi:hypothetical protein
VTSKTQSSGARRGKPGEDNFRAWDEDPRFQEAAYRVLVGGVVIVVIAGFMLALVSGEWALYLTVLRFLAAVLLALCVYAALVWIVGQTVKLVWRLVCRLKRKQPHV